MAIVRALSPPDYFITFTCNPAWPEITCELFPHQTAADRPDLTDRVFHIKLKQLLKDITEFGIFGTAIGKIHVIEFQKRGLPHVHLLLIVSSEHKPQVPADYDTYISAEIPDHTTHPAAYTAVTTSMFHGPCGSSYPSTPCMVNGACSKGYPKPFQDCTTINPSGFVHHRRHNNNIVFVRNGFTFDNRWIVPHNLYLSAKYCAHINVECCSSSIAIKYLFKYVYKGHDRATTILTESSHGISKNNLQDGNLQEHGHDEIQEFIDGRYVSASEAGWRIYGFPIHKAEPSVIRLHLHLPGLFMHTFKDDELLTVVEERAREERTSLTAFFDFNNTYQTTYPPLPPLPPTLYHDFPCTHVYHKRNNEWTIRQRGSAIGRMFFVDPTAGELFYLRTLLTVVPNPTSFSFLRTVDGIVHLTFKDACIALGLLQDDDEWVVCLHEAEQYQSAHQLRSLFAKILAFCQPTNPSDLWLQFRHSLSDDCEPREERNALYDENMLEDMTHQRANCALLLIQDLLHELGKKISDYMDMPQPTVPVDEPAINQLIADELSYDLPSKEELAAMEQSLNCKQAAAYTAIMHAYNSNATAAFFIDGPAGVYSLLSFVYHLFMT